MTHPMWIKHEANIRHEMSGSPNCARPWEWGTILATMYVGASPLLEAQLHEMTEAGVAIPTWDDLDATNLLCQRYHLWRWERMHPGAYVAGLQTICEVGGGYGAMAIVCSRLGFKGNYYIYDLPTLQELQERHLANRDLACNVYHGLHSKPDLLISTFGLSEFPVEERDVLLRGIKPRSWLLAFQSTFEEVNNDQYFTEWATHQFYDTSILWHLQSGPMHSNANYLTSYWGRR